jgi:taurine--2-oxoglutarate transaminase
MTSTDRAAVSTSAEVVADPARGREVYDLDRAYVFYSWSAQSRIRPMVLAGAQGSYVWDFEGKRYLDFSSQMVNTNIGHQHPVVVEAIREQAGRLCTIAPQHANDQRSEAARRIVDRARFAEGAKVFFTNAGAEAVEHAVRMARLHTGRPKLLATYRSYHGATGTAINLTGDARRWPNDTGTAGVEHFFGPFLYRSPFHSSSPEEESARALAHLEQVIALEGPSTIAAIILETVPGTSGIMPPPPGYLAGVRALCDQHGILLIADEVMCGFGRCGEWFAVDHWEVTPDLITFAKGVNSGYVPLGGVVVAGPIVDTFAERPYPGGLTYSGHPLACAAAVATIDLMERDRIVEHAATIGATVLGPGLAELAASHPVVGDARGLGVFWALELVTDRDTKEPLAPYGSSSPAMDELAAACRERGLLPFTNYNRLHVVPPCTVSVAEAQEGLAILDEALAIADRHYVGS